MKLAVLALPTPENIRNSAFLNPHSLQNLGYNKLTGLTKFLEGLSEKIQCCIT